MADKGSDECIRYWSENSDSNAYLENKKKIKRHAYHTTGILQCSNYSVQVQNM